MKQMLLFSAISLILLASSVSVNADVALPKSSPQKGKVVMNTGLEVATDATAYDARLQIPKAKLAELRAALANEDGDRSTTLGIAYSSARTIVAGLFLFMSLSFGGVLMARAGQSRGQKVLAAVMLGTALVAATAIITQANAGPPPGYVWRNLSQNLNAGRATHGPLKIEIVDEGTGVRLILPLKVTARPDLKPGEE
ncbi:MAG: hypothetical protein ND895_10950 [Pyrinomonadaceae bacterium]|nr:hypothetical protein [Pyrinomonadaceae bacterium]